MSDSAIPPESRPMSASRIDARTHRRIMFNDLMKYKLEMDRMRLGALEKLSAQAQELDMGY